MTEEKLLQNRKRVLKMEKCDSLFMIQTVLSFFFSFIEEPRINVQKEAKRGTPLTSWVFRNSAGFHRR